MKRKIYFVVTFASRFISVPAGFGWNFNVDIPDRTGKIVEYTALPIEYEQIDKDPIVDAYKALEEWGRLNHPNMDFRTYYWTLEFI